MLALSSGRYTVLRSVGGVDEYGDDTSETKQVHENILGAVMERTRQDYNQTDGRLDTVRVLTGRFSHGTDIQDGDHLKDESTGKIYIVASVAHGTAIIGKPDLVLELSNADS